MANKTSSNDPRIKDCLILLKKNTIPIADILTRVGISNTTFYKWKNSGFFDTYYNALDPSEPVSAKKSEKLLEKAGAPYKEVGGNKLIEGNPGGGRHRGRPDNKTIFLRDITPEMAGEILAMFIQKCKDGDVECILFAMKRLYPESAAPRFTSIKLPGKEALETIKGVQNVSADVLLDVAEGIVSIDDATGFLNLLDKHQNINMGVINDEADRFEEIKKAQGIIL